MLDKKMVFIICIFIWGLITLGNQCRLLCFCIFYYEHINGRCGIRKFCHPAGEKMLKVTLTRTERGAWLVILLCIYIHDDRLTNTS